MRMNVSVQELMERSGVRFGTSGARGLVTQMTDWVCYAYTRAFLQHLESVGELTRDGRPVAVAGDLRPSTDRMMEAVFRAIEDARYTPVNCGKIPSPAVALYGLVQGIPAVMVTGSHIPADRNGIKFNKCTGEILKEDEAGIRSQVVVAPDGLVDGAGAFRDRQPRRRSLHRDARDLYRERYLSFYPDGALRGKRIGLYQHSAVGRELLAEILAGLGAEVMPLGRSEEFIPVDTEAIRAEDVELARHWAERHHFDAIVSIDGDSDRPLVSDEDGRWLRGDVAGILCACYLEADVVCTPVSCNTAVEKCGFFKEVIRTRIGSPFVVAAMLEASARGGRRVVGYEANGGFLVQSDLAVGGKVLRALPTRDATILIVSVLLLAGQQGQGISALAAGLPARATASDRLENFPQEQSQAILNRFSTGQEAADALALERVFGGVFGQVAAVDRTDGIRVTFVSGEIMHLRPSGNAPEFRCYTEAVSQGRADEMNAVCLQIVRGLSRAES